MVFNMRSNVLLEGSCSLDKTVEKGTERLAIRFAVEVVSGFVGGGEVTGGRTEEEARFEVEASTTISDSGGSSSISAIASSKAEVDLVKTLEEAEEVNGSEIGSKEDGGLEMEERGT